MSDFILTALWQGSYLVWRHCWLFVSYLRVVRIIYHRAGAQAGFSAVGGMMLHWSAIARSNNKQEMLNLSWFRFLTFSYLEQRWPDRDRLCLDLFLSFSFPLLLSLSMFLLSLIWLPCTQPSWQTISSPTNNTSITKLYFSMFGCNTPFYCIVVELGLLGSG